MSDEITPALTPDEWDHVLTSGDVDISGLLSHYGDGADMLAGYGRPRRTRDECCKVLAALALYGQPFGFTHEDVAEIRLMAAPESMWYRENEHLTRIADKIAAFLPPTRP